MSSDKGMVNAVVIQGGSHSRFAHRTIALISLFACCVAVYLHYTIDTSHSTAFHAFIIPVIGSLIAVIVFCLVALRCRSAWSLLEAIRLILWAMIGASVMIRQYDKYFFVNMPDYLPLMRTLAMITWWVPMAGFAIMIAIGIMRRRANRPHVPEGKLSG